MRFGLEIKRRINLVNSWHIVLGRPLKSSKISIKNPNNGAFNVAHREICGPVHTHMRTTKPGHPLNLWKYQVKKYRSTLDASSCWNFVKLRGCRREGFLVLAQTDKEV